MLNFEQYVLKKSPKIAVIHDWLVTYGGAERVLSQILECYPQAELFCTIEGLPDSIRNKYPGKITTTFIQNLPFSKKLYWYYSPLMPVAIEQLDLFEYDIILSCCHGFAKGVICHPHQLHVSYIHSPARFIWDLQFDYFKNFSFKNGLKRKLASYAFHRMRIWDVRTSNSVDTMIANSKFVRRRILKCYRRDSEMIYPGIDTTRFAFCDNKQDYFLAGSFMNPFKRLDLIVNAFNRTPEHKLLLFGSGPQEKYLKKIAGRNIIFLGKVPDETLVSLMQKAKAFVFAATEDFGMIMAEAQSCGTPVIAYNRGGASEIVINIDYKSKKPTGILYNQLSVGSLLDAIGQFEMCSKEIIPSNCRDNALRFDVSNFKKKYTDIVGNEWEKWLFRLEED